MLKGAQARALALKILQVWPPPSCCTWCCEVTSRILCPCSQLGVPGLAFTCLIWHQPEMCWQWLPSSLTPQSHSSPDLLVLFSAGRGCVHCLTCIYLYPPTLKRAFSALAAPSICSGALLCCLCSVCAVLLLYTLQVPCADCALFALCHHAPLSAKGPMLTVCFPEALLEVYILEIHAAKTPCNTINISCLLCRMGRVCPVVPAGRAPHHCHR